MKNKYPFLLILLVFHLFLLFNLQFTAWPEMFSFPYLLNNGFGLYRDMVVPYPPFLILVLAGLFKVFGYKVVVLKIFAWALILASDVVLFLILKRLFKKDYLIFFSLITYIFLQSFLDGNMLWFDNVLVLPVLLIFYNLVKYFRNKDKKSLMYIGLFSAVAVLIKQTAAIYFLISFLIVLIIEKANIKKISGIFLFPAFGALIFVGYLLLSGDFAHFWNWTIYFPFKFWSKLPNYVDLDLSFSEARNLRLALLALLPFFVNILKSRRIERVVVWFLLAALIAIYPRFSYFHLQPALPFYAILVSVTLGGLRKFWKISYLVFVVVIAVTIIRPFAFVNWKVGTRFVDDMNKVVLQELNSVSNKDTVFLMGYHSLYYVYSQKLPPKPWLDIYNWHYEIPGVQESVLNSFIQNPPGVVLIDPSTNYFPKQIVNWVQNNYNLDELDENIQIWRKEN